MKGRTNFSNGLRVLFQHSLAGLATLLVAGSFFATEAISDVTNPMSLTLLRFVGAILILGPFVLCKAEFRRQALQLLPRGLVMGFFYSAFFVCFFRSLQTTSTLNTSSLYTLAPFLTAILALIVFGEKVPARKLSAYILGVCGTVWVVFQGNFDLMRSFALNRGDLIFLFGVFLMCLFSISLKKMACEKCHPFVLVFCVLLGGALWMSLAMVLFNRPLGWRNISSGDVLQLGYLVIFATIATVFLYQRATVDLGPGRVMAYGYLNPGIVAFLQFFLFGDPVPVIVWPGLVTSIVATVILEFD